MNYMNGKWKLLPILGLLACTANTKPAAPASLPIEGTWQLLSSAYIKKDTTIRNDAPGTRMIKILNGSHFAFLLHEVRTPGDTLAPRSFSAGGGSYTLVNDHYTEHLEYCSARDYEGKDFEFTVALHGDTLIQSGVEKLKEYGIGEEDLPLVEKYIRVNP